ncbi:hydroxyisourate hydrolase [Leptolyngbya sp. BC1307]|uniref:hydroxyisourate hydrolase n=1 Tax=Leptolyngbya sp. BC1307 TaxID=2029589 RepID=UPI000EFCBB8C|nr:hydroxyisourate hydrolase [Leptolyngbya sp. BC1307]
MTGKLTTHVLDTAHGCPAAGLEIELWQIDPLQAASLIKTVTTNSDGRTDSPLLADTDLKVGIYELRFAVNAYFKSKVSELPDPPFLEVVPIRFGIADVSAHYHVPLLCSPWSYSTYRGS